MPLSIENAVFLLQSFGVIRQHSDNVPAQRVVPCPVPPCTSAWIRMTICSAAMRRSHNSSQNQPPQPQRPT